MFVEINRWGHRSRPLSDSQVATKQTQNMTNTPSHFGSAGLPVSKNNAATPAAAASQQTISAPILIVRKKSMAR